MNRILVTVAAAAAIAAVGLAVVIATRETVGAIPALVVYGATIVAVVVLVRIRARRVGT